MATGTAEPRIVGRPPLAETLVSPSRDWLVDLRRTAPILSLAILAVLVVLPLLVMLIASFRPAGTFPFDLGPIVLSNFADAYFTPNTFAMLANTAMYATVPLLFALPLAFGLAFLTERTDLPLRGHIYSVMFVPMSVPIFATAMSWFLLLGPRAGTLNMWIRTLLGLDIRDGPFNILSLQGMIFVH